MFSILADGLKTEGPKSNMIAEPAQVVVMMPNSRVNKAETELRDLKTGIFVVGLFILGLLILGLWWALSRPRQNLDIMPSIQKTKSSVSNGPDFTAKKAELKDEILLGGPPQFGQQRGQPVGHQVQVGPQKVTEPKIELQKAMHMKPRADVEVPLDDIVRVTGHIPVWDIDEKDIVETKVSESDATIAAMVRERERISKSLETKPVDEVAI